MHLRDNQFFELTYVLYIKTYRFWYFLSVVFRFWKVNVFEKGLCFWSDMYPHCFIGLFIVLYNPAVHVRCTKCYVFFSSNAFNNITSFMQLLQVQILYIITKMYRYYKYYLHWNKLIFVFVVWIILLKYLN